MKFSFSRIIHKGVPQYRFRIGEATCIAPSLAQALYIIGKAI